MSNGASEPKDGEMVIADNCDACDDGQKKTLESFKGPVHVDISQAGKIVITKRKPDPADPKKGPHYNFRRKKP